MNLQYALDTLKRRYNDHLTKLERAVVAKNADNVARFSIRQDELKYAIEVLEAAMGDSK